MLNLLKLDEEILSFMQNLDPSDERLRMLTERGLRPLTQILDGVEQKRAFKEIVNFAYSPEE